MLRCTFRFARVVTLMLALGAIAPSAAWAQDGAQAPETPQALAPFDMTGNWVSVVTEDWRWRMVTPPKGDFASVPLNDEGQRLLNEWDPAQDGSCLAYGVGGLMRMPMRLQIAWQGEQALRLEIDAGSQTRTLNFVAGDLGPRSLQGYSVARWSQTGDDDGEPSGYLQVVTSNVTAAWLRRNGIPYSEDAVITEYFDRFATPDGDEWLTVLTVVTDRAYLNQPFITTTQFKREADASRRMPTSCQ